MNKNELLKRTHLFAVNIFKVIEKLPQRPLNLSLYSQLIRSASSVSANYRAACKAKSSKDFTYKISIVLEEIDEAKYWLEFFDDTGISAQIDIDELKIESRELTAIFTAILKTLRAQSKD